VLPGVALLALPFILPVIAVFAIALTSWQFGSASLSFAGLVNFREVLDDEIFRTPLLNTPIYVADRRAGNGRFWPVGRVADRGKGKHGH
jgi:ABC-type sugar transport system permease subunit